MLLTIALLMLFAVVAIATLSTIADALVRGMNAYTLLKRAMKEGEERLAHVRLIETVEITRLPSARPARPARTGACASNAHRPVRPFSAAA